MSSVVGWQSDWVARSTDAVNVDYQRLSQLEIGGDKRIYQQLSESERSICQIVITDDATVAQNLSPTENTTTGSVSPILKICVPNVAFLWVNCTRSPRWTSSAV